ncbi:unnamed protein product [Leptosia nina]|uniref:Uncharacterized protein n=1 Tax=Leptosia nina TaxID=320188 RepID=A0AAV1J4R7_9NEOP
MITTLDGFIFVFFLYVLSWVIERYQTESGSGGRSSGIHSASASPSPSDRSSPRSHELISLSRNTREVSPSVSALRGDDVSDWEEGEGTDDAVELPHPVPFPEFGGDIVHSTEDIDRDFDEVSGSDIQATDGSWEENWLFQKKKIKNIQSVPVPMLVPNSNTEYRVLIGDRDADDTTDLSDNASDAEDQDVTYKSDIKKVLDSKHLIGGKPKIGEVLEFEPDSLMSIDGRISDNYSKDEDTVDSLDTSLQDVSKQEKVQCINANMNESVLELSTDSGPLLKTEFNLKEEIHRTANGSVEYDSLSNSERNTNSLENNESPHDKELTNTLSRHEREGEYEETVSIPVQRYADSLRRKHFEEPQPNNVSNGVDDELIPGSIAYRERKKWLNYVDMPNNPYSPEAIKKRLSAKSTSSLFDTLTTKQSSENKFASNEDVTAHRIDDNNKQTHKMSASQSTECLSSNGRSPSPSTKVLKDVLAEEIPQYKRYGRDYYIKEAKLSSGGREKTFSDTSSMSSSINKSSSLDNFDTEFASPVSASSSLSDLEACSLHQNIARAVFSPRNASPNFAINPIFENPLEIADDIAYRRNVSRTNVRDYNNLYNGGDGYVENENIVRLNIPKTPEISEEHFETYHNVRRSQTLRSGDSYARIKRRPGLNHCFGGSLRLSHGFRSDLCNTQQYSAKILVELLIQQFNTIAANQDYTKFGAKEQDHKAISKVPIEGKNEILIEYEDTDDVFVAKPILVDEDTDRKFNEILDSVNTEKQISIMIEDHEKSPSRNSIENSYSSSSIEDSIKVYNVQTGEIVKCKPEDKVSQRYEQTADENDNKHSADNEIHVEIIDSLSQNAKLNTDASSEKDLSEPPLVESRLEKITEIDEILPQLPKVKELAKRFLSMDNLNEPTKPPHQLWRRRSRENILDAKDKPKHMFMHSLTARSISKEFREELKLSRPTNITVPGGAKESPEGADEVLKESSPERPESPVPEPGTIKTKLAFFESLKSKFSNK